jgi:hypothetical protein
VTPEEQFLAHNTQRIENVVKQALCMTTCKFQIANSPIFFAISMQIWQDNDWDHEAFSNFCKRIINENNLINNSSYKAIADELYKMMATELPGREIWINMSWNHYELLIKYSQ